MWQSQRNIHLYVSEFVIVMQCNHFSLPFISMIFLVFHENLKFLTIMIKKQFGMKIYLRDIFFCTVRRDSLFFCKKENHPIKTRSKKAHTHTLFIIIIIINIIIRRLHFLINSHNIILGFAVSITLHQLSEMNIHCLLGLYILCLCFWERHYHSCLWKV